MVWAIRLPVEESERHGSRYCGGALVDAELESSGGCAVSLGRRMRGID
jgi:hypothetical protein